MQTNQKQSEDRILLVVVCLIVALLFFIVFKNQIFEAVKKAFPPLPGISKNRDWLGIGADFVQIISLLTIGMAAYRFRKELKEQVLLRTPKVSVFNLRAPSYDTNSTQRFLAEPTVQYLTQLEGLGPSRDIREEPIDTSTQYLQLWEFLGLPESPENASDLFFSIKLHNSQGPAEKIILRIRFSYSKSNNTVLDKLFDVWLPPSGLSLGNQKRDQLFVRYSSAKIRSEGYTRVKVSIQEYLYENHAGKLFHISQEPELAEEFDLMSNLPGS